MTHLMIGGVDLSPYIWNDTSVQDWPQAITIDRAVIALDPEAGVGHGGPGDWSGIHWTFLARNDGTRTEHNHDSFAIGEDERWRIALSYRGPFITALSWRDLKNCEDKVTSPALVAMVKKLAEKLRLTYLDAHQLRALEIPWDELQNDAEMRLDDYTTLPNAFTLLFYEYG